MERYEKVATVETEVQAQIADAILTDRGIPHLMRSYHDAAYDGVFQLSRGWGHIEAPSEFREEIVALVQELGHPSPPPESEPEEPRKEL